MKKIILFLLVSAIVYAAFFTEKDRLDREVKRLCAIDGGIKVYETVKLPAAKFDQYGQVQVPAKWLAKLEDEYYYEITELNFVTGNPEMYQLHLRLYRAVDNKLLGESISYSRRGGDLPGPWHSSSFSCPEEAGLNNLRKQLFVKE